MLWKFSGISQVEILKLIDRSPTNELELLAAMCRQIIGEVQPLVESDLIELDSITKDKAICIELEAVCILKAALEKLKGKPA